jgi:hypothetical protein
MRTRLAPILILATVGCGKQAGHLAGDGGAPQSYRVDFGPIAVPAGTENTQCIIKRLGNAAPLHVGSVHNLLGNASHHMVVYRVNDTTEQTTPFNCRPFQDAVSGNGSPIIISQKNDDVLEMPRGVAYTLDANQMMRIELHYINATSADVMLTASATLTEVLDYQQEASFLLIGDMDITVPANSDATLGPVFLPLDPKYADANFFALTGHTHKLGTDVKVGVASGDTDTGSMVYDVPNWVWSEPATVQHNPAFTVPAGGGFRFTCSWHNPTTAPVKFGESANDEMCFFWAYYYPSHGSHVCVHSTSNGMPTNYCLN